jgi:hypothetical protein
MENNDRFKVRAQASEMLPEQRVLRFPHLLGGLPKFRKLRAADRLRHLQRSEGSEQFPHLQRVIQITPDSPARDEEFSIAISKRPFSGMEKKIAFIRMEVRMPSGSIHRLEFLPEEVEESQDEVIVRGFSSQAAGDLYVSARIYFSDGSTLSDARTALVLSRNPDYMAITPQVWLVSGGGGRVEYDWDTNEFHCRAYAYVTNGSDVTRTYTTCSVNVWDGGVGKDLIESFSFSMGPFPVDPDGTAYVVLDTWYPQGNATHEIFRQLWDLTLEFTFTAIDGTTVTDNSPYRAMAWVPINVIMTTEFTNEQVIALENALQIACEILEVRDLTLFEPSWRILTEPNDRARFSTIDLGWTGSNYDYDEANDMYEEISGPEEDRLDVFIPLAFGYADNVPPDKQNVGGFSTVNGPFPKDAAPRQSGSLVLMSEFDHEFFGVAIAHEICHYLSLTHVADEDNLMHKNGGITGHDLTFAQWSQLRPHGMVFWLAPDI